MSTAFASPDSYPIDGRGRAYSYAYFSAKHLGAGQYYLMTIKDGQAGPLDGGKNYRLTVPSSPPVRQYWSATAYDRRTHALIRNTRWSSRSSQTPGVQENSDGSVTLHFGPKAPQGKESNWVPTKAGGGFEVLFRLYGPEKAFFEKKLEAAGYREGEMKKSEGSAGTAGSGPERSRPGSANSSSWAAIQPANRSSV